MGCLFTDVYFLLRVIVFDCVRVRAGRVSVFPQAYPLEGSGFFNPSSVNTFACDSDELKTKSEGLWAVFHTGELFMCGPCCQWSTGELVRYHRLFLVHDALLYSVLIALV